MASTYAAPKASGSPISAVQPTAATLPAISTAAAASAIYAVPAAILLFITFLALARLITLRARAEVLVDGHWLTALARAQRRMGFKHGTALLTSNALASPISWGLMRPVILLNTRAVQASGEAEAIIAHELAHVARMDWAKLLLARVATALFWFNPLVWVLAREAHQLREETADDAVLASDVPDTDYAQLLVGVARHECPGLLLGAHGVAPSKSSLARRVARVLDGKSVRGPAARSFAAGVFVGAILVAAPLAALTLTPGGIPLSLRKRASPLPEADRHRPIILRRPTFRPISGTSSPAAFRLQSRPLRAAIAPAKPVEPDFAAVAPNGATVNRKHGVTYATAPSGASVVVYPADRDGRTKVVATAPSGATAVTYVQADKIAGLMAGYGASPHATTSIDTAIELKAAGVTPEYVAEMRALGHRFAALDPGNSPACARWGHFAIRARSHGRRLPGNRFGCAGRGTCDRADRRLRPRHALRGSARQSRRFRPAPRGGHRPCVRGTGEESGDEGRERRRPRRNAGGRDSEAASASGSAEGRSGP